MIPKRPFGRTGKEVAVIGQGTWQMRDRRPGGGGEESLRRGLDLGMTHIDTAELYRGSEEVVGRVIEGRRDEVFLVSKVLPQNASATGTRNALETSLAKLGTDHVDVYLLHWRGGQHPLEDTMRALGDLVDDGLTRHLGVSNFDVADLEDAAAILGPDRIVENQVRYHLEDREIEAETIPYCRNHGIAVVGYSPFGSGRFPDGKSPGGRVLLEISGRLGKTPRQVALAFLTRDPSVFAIPKAESLPHVEENAGAAFALDAADVARIDAAFPG